ncbi:MAG: FecR domain-containing protein [Cytophagales bacterium]|nr:FecR domain-containing protein [Bernardetiaceae bacterium]MDW8210679.1 FecR domain-containing protein [Cytophagales bacterium]
MERLQYSVEDFLADPTFQRYAWALLGQESAENIEARQFWERWIEAHPEKEEQVQQALELIKQLQNLEARPALTPLEVSRMWEKVQMRLVQVQTSTPAQVTLQASWRRMWYYAASVVTILAATAGLLYWYWLVPVEIATEVGKNYTVVLPDSSTVVLSGNSKLRYARYWFKERPREVWLTEGKAYFNVNHAASDKHSFIVYAGKARVEVVGTTFDVVNRDKSVKVVLKSGALKMQVMEEKEESPAVTTMLQPGEEAELPANAQVITKRKVRSIERSMDWVQQRFLFDNTPFEEVAKAIEENCGVKITIRNSALRTRRITAQLDSKNLDLFLTGIAKLFDAKVKRKGESVIFY